MSRTFTSLGLDGVVLVSPTVHGDDRGFFVERFKASEYARHGIGPFVQDNHSRSSEGVLRGIHWQISPHAQGKLVSVVQGEIFDVAVDLRQGSPTFGRWVGAHLDGRSHAQLWVPCGFGHGFLVLSESADVVYKTTSEYAPEAERGCRWNDAEVAIDWPRPNDAPAPTVSERDASLPFVRDLDPVDLFQVDREGRSR